MSKKEKIFSKQMAETPAEVVRDFFNVGKVKRIFRLGSEVFNAVSPVVEKPNALNVLKAVMHIGRVVVDDLEIWPDDFFDEAWMTPYPHDFNKLILRALENKPYKLIRTSDESTVIYLVHVGDVKFGYVANLKSKYIERIYVEGNKVEEAREIIKNELWKLMKDDNIVLRHVRNPRSKDDDSIVLEVDDVFQPMPSKRANEYVTYLKKCIEAGVSRSVMLYGPPGTGKSTMARTIVNNLGLKSFRIRVEDIGQIETSAVFEAINIFEPDAIILDDFDRSSEQSALLETLEFFQRHVKLVIATVNNKSNLDHAILRPGRFDELLQIKQMDEDVVKSVLGEEHAAAYDLVKEWPIAFIQEYVKRLRFMTPAEAEASTKELAHRVKMISRYDEDDEMQEVTRVLDEGTASHRGIEEIFGLAVKKKRRRRKV
jgi:ABC-type cobalamin/Fe3+-siderophores transport system ATPase subunit